MSARFSCHQLAAAIVGAVTVAVGCGGGAPPTSSPGSPLAGSPAAGVRAIDVKATDALRFEPAAITVKAGERVRFVVRNTGTVDHEFYVGDQAAQEEHEKEMAGGGMMHEDPNGIEVPAGQTRELEMSFDAPAQLLIGCHVLGHWPAGMKASLTVEA
jgi:uncharacterized cupredoxin-like copper-binding protein